ncbi:hypothetical protein GCM10009591_28280 [Brachybacterium tyrofermentans]
MVEAILVTPDVTRDVTPDVEPDVEPEIVFVLPTVLRDAAPTLPGRGRPTRATHARRSQPSRFLVAASPSCTVGRCVRSDSTA